MENKGYKLKLDYDSYAPSIWTHPEIGFREFWYYCAMYKSNVRVVWPLRKDEPMDLRRVQAYLHETWPYCRFGKYGEVSVMHAGKHLIVESERDGYPTITHLAILREFDGQAHDIGVLHHEIEHVARDILEKIGYKFEGPTEEAFTYLSEHLFTMALDAILNPFQGTPEDYVI